MAAVRRVVSSPRGVVSDGPPPSVVTSADGGPDVAMVWSTQDGVAVLSAGDEDPTVSLGEALFPGVGGTRFMVVDHPPGAGVTGGFGGSGADLAKHGLDERGLHQTDTVDFVVVVSGRVCVELGDGSEVELGPGDTFVQNGALHAWRNRSDDHARVAVILIGAQRS